MNLEHLRNAPPHVKSKYAFFGAFFITLIITGIWTTSLPARFANLNGVLKQSSEGTTNAAGAVTNSLTNFLNTTNPDDINKTGEGETRATAETAGGDAGNDTGELSKLLYDFNPDGENATSTEPTPPVSKTEPEEPIVTELAPPPVVITKPQVILIGTTTSKKSE